MDFAFDEEQRLLRATARSFLAERSTSEHVRAAMASEQGFDAVYLGFGAMAGLFLGVKGDDLPGNLFALDVLRAFHRGEPVDARGKRVLVVGGGDAALDVARTMLRLGAASVRMVSTMPYSYGSSGTGCS